MEYLQKCITPRVKTPEDIAFDESREYYKNYGRVWSDDDLQQFRVKYESQYPPRQIQMERDDFIFSHCITCCTRRCRNVTATATATSSSAQEQKKYIGDGSFMTFHIRVLFCLE